MCTTKRILKINISVVIVTVGLPKARKSYGNEKLIVAVSKISLFSNT